ncbi:hypothetical protein ACFE04_001561 [Oxalis oulophora]
MEKEGKLDWDFSTVRLCFFYRESEPTEPIDTDLRLVSYFNGKSGTFMKCHKVEASSLDSTLVSHTTLHSGSILQNRYGYMILFSVRNDGEDDGRAAGLSSMDSSRRRLSGQMMNSGNMLKQKAPVDSPGVSKDVMLTGEIPFNIGFLQVATLSLQGNQLSGNIPSVIGLMQALAVFSHLWRCNFQMLYAKAPRRRAALSLDCLTNLSYPF